jgi:hypothetical protein
MVFEILLREAKFFLTFAAQEIMISKMKKMIFAILLSMLWAMPACNNNNDTTEPADTPVAIVADTTTVSPLYDTVGIDPKVVAKENCFIVIAKPEYRLYVCEAVEDDTLCRACYPVCVGLNTGHKQKPGDMRTPESSFENPFTITQITDASNWTHDFGDGRGEILAYGNWFMRLATPGFTGIGIHGSTNNEASVPGRGSEGCIRLRNNDLDQLKAQYAFVGMKVVILPDILQSTEK